MTSSIILRFIAICIFFILLFKYTRIQANSGRGLNKDSRICVDLSVLSDAVPPGCQHSVLHHCDF